MNIVVYCSSQTGLADNIVEAASMLGQWIGTSGNVLVYGGVDAGLMHTVAQASHDAGAEIVGVVPEVFAHRADKLCNRLIGTSDLNTRKAEMIRLADVFVVLPGGIGTIDEWISTLSSIMVMERTDPTINKPVIVLNIDGMYDGLVEQLSTTSKSVFARGAKIDRSVIVTSPQQLIEQLDALNLG